MTRVVHILYILQVLRTSKRKQRFSPEVWNNHDKFTEDTFHGEFYFYFSFRNVSSVSRSNTNIAAVHNAYRFLVVNMCVNNTNNNVCACFFKIFFFLFTIELPV